VRPSPCARRSCAGRPATPGLTAVRGRAEDRPERRKVVYDTRRKRAAPKKAGEEEEAEEPAAEAPAEART